MSKITGTISSAKGFYIGDLCYVLSDTVYDKVWGGAGYEDGVYTDPESGYSFAVAGTAYGDGCYADNHLNHYPVDAGNISLVPAELVAKDSDGGNFFDGAGCATFEAEDGTFVINLPSGETIIIETGDNQDEDDEY